MLPQQHNHRKKKNMIYNQQLSPIVIIFTVLMPTNCVILEFFVFDIDLVGFDYYVQTFFLFFIYIMAMWSYAQAILIKNDTLPRPPPQPDNRDIDPIYKNTAACVECNRWKPVRAHHCSICGKCVLKMDHHCPWIANCVGLRNHRAFYLFTLYMMLGGLQYAWRSWVYFRVLYFSPSFFSKHILFYAYWTFNSVVLYPTAAMLGFLFFYHTMLIFTNKTTIEQMKGGQQQGCLPNKSERPTYINVYDRGWIANAAWFFDYSYLWWMPFENIYENDGTSYPIAPLCTFEDMNKFNEKDENKLDMNHRVDFDNINQQYLEYLEQAKLKYKGKKIIVQNETIEIE